MSSFVTARVFSNYILWFFVLSLCLVSISSVFFLVHPILLLIYKVPHQPCSQGLPISSLPQFAFYRSLVTTLLDHCMGYTPTVLVFYVTEFCKICCLVSLLFYLINLSEFLCPHVFLGSFTLQTLDNFRGKLQQEIVQRQMDRWWHNSLILGVKKYSCKWIKII